VDLIINKHCSVKTLDEVVVRVSVSLAVKVQVSLAVKVQVRMSVSLAVLV
jgi:hypothetical protein